MASLPLITSVGITSAFFLSGIYFSATQMTIPCLYQRDVAFKTSYFEQFFHAGLKTVAPLSILSSACYAYAAYELPEQRTVYALSPFTMLAPLLYSKIVMESTIRALINAAKSSAERNKLGSMGVDGLLKKWAEMNFVRSVLSFAGGIGGFWAAGHKYGAL